MKRGLSEIDRRLLRVIQLDSRLSMIELSARIGMSSSACHRRLKSLEERGYVAAYRALLDRHRLGLDMEFFVEVSLGSQEKSALDAFEAAVRIIPEIMACHLIAGRYDYFLHVVCEDRAAFDRLHQRLVSGLPGVAKVNSTMSIRETKQFTGLPL